MKSFTSRAVLAASVAAAFAPTAFAQSTMAPVVVTAARMPQSARDVLNDTLVITAEEIANSGQRSLVDLLQQKRGFEIARNGGPGTTSSVFIRGAANSQSVVLVDGVRIGSSTLGGATWETIPLSQIDHVEVVYGPMSSLYGADAIGGVVQIFTKQGDGAPRVNAQAGFGGYGTRSIDAGVAGSGNGVHYALQAGHEQADGFSASKPSADAFTFNPDRDGYRSNSVSGHVSIDLAKGHELGLNLLHNNLDAQYDAGPGVDDRTQTKLGTYALYAKNQLGAHWNSLLQIAQSIDQARNFPTFADHVDSTQNQISWQNDISFGSDVLQVVLERRLEKVIAQAAELTGDRSTNSVAASYRLQRGMHSASIAVRNDDSSQFGAHTTGSLDYGYRLSEAWRVNAGIGTSFRAPTFNELFFPGYGVSSNQPERGRNAEFGVHYDQGTTQLSVVAYRNRITDLLVFAPLCPVQQDTHPFGCAFNVDQAVLQGVSMSAAEKFGSLSLRAALDLQDPRDETRDKRLARRARQHGSVALEYAAGGLTGGAEVVFSGARFDDGDNLDLLGGYALLNLYASRALSDNWTLFGRWNNVSGKNYELARNYATPGSNLFVGLRYAMK